MAGSARRAGRKHTPPRLVPLFGREQSTWNRAGRGRSVHGVAGRITLPAMTSLVFQLCISAVAGWINRGQQQVIEYLVEENRALREQPMHGELF